MATSNRIAKEPAKEATSVVVQQLVVQSVDRTPKDVLSWRDAHKGAESVQNPNRVRLYDLYSDVELDGHLTGIVGKRIDAVLNKKLRFEKDGAADDAMDKLIASNAFREVMKEIMLSMFWGISGFEFLPGEFAFKKIPRKHIRPEKHLIVKHQNDQEGTNYEGLSNVFIVGDEKDLGLYLKCSFYALIKKGDFGDWGQYVEIFGQPIRVIKYDAYDNKTKLELRQVLDESGGALALMIPKQAEFEIMDGKQVNGDGQLQERLKNACNNEMSIIVLGNTETTSNDNGGSNAKAKEQGKQQLEITKSDVQFVVNILNSVKFIEILRSFNYPVDGGSFTIEKEIDLEALAKRIVIDTQVSAKVPVEDDYWYDTYGVPKPANYAALRKKMDDEKEMMLQQKMNNNPPQKDKKVKPAKKLNAIDKMRLALADFFAPAHKE